MAKSFRQRGSEHIIIVFTDNLLDLNVATFSKILLQLTNFHLNFPSTPNGVAGVA